MTEPKALLDLTPYAGKWIAQRRTGRVITAADSLHELEIQLVARRIWPERVAIMRVPEPGTYLL